MIELSAKKLITLGLVCFILTVLVRLPAAPFIAALPLPPSVEMASVGGTLWNGSCQVISKSAPAQLSRASISWDLNLLKLFLLTLSIDIELRVGRNQVAGTVEKSAFAERASGISGSLDITELARALGKPVNVPGKVLLNEITIEYGGDQFEQASGGLLWPGGEVSYSGGKKPYSAELSPLEGVLTSQEGELGLRVSERGRDVALADVNLDGQGIARVKVYRYAMNLVGMAISGGDPGESVFEWSGPVFSR